MNDLTALDLEMARRALETARAPVFSLAAAIEAARKRHLRGEAQSLTLLDPSTRPSNAADAALWDRIQSARARVMACLAQHPQAAAARPDEPIEQMTDDELRARIAALRRGQQ
ncbi:hypothetical protein [Paraburkholderia sp. HD33-4]|uniref:hypothetical protein n=1 Tax=Paraburkholderia sp. HD33-4 TaxID=2883242 RepID=UPI001F19A6E1|nr:hypothetical protein [Paraburkholderia sp. HD33-4]